MSSGPAYRRRVPLPPDARAKFDRLRMRMGPNPLAEMLGVSVTTVLLLEDDGMALHGTVERVIEALALVDERRAG